MLTQTRWVSDSGQKGAVVTLVELEEEGETNSWKGVSQEVILGIGILGHVTDSILTSGDCEGAQNLGSGAEM